MARVGNRARVGDAFDLLAQCLKPFVDERMARTVSGGRDWGAVFAATARPPIPYHANSTDDPMFLLRVIADRWRGDFERYLPRSARNLVFTLRGERSEWAHNPAVKLHDALCALSGILTLVEAVDASKAPPVQEMLDDLNRTVYERERGGGPGGGAAGALNVVDFPKAGLRPWREVIHPHSDVHSERFNVAEFAADLEIGTPRRRGREGRSA